MNNREIIARRVAQEFEDGDFVNLGIGIPTLSTAYLPEGVNVVLHSENGHYNFGPLTCEEDKDPDSINASGELCVVRNGGVFFDSTVSFDIIRGGFIDKTVLGALQVDQEGNLANWKIPGRVVPGIGGGMDLVVGAKKVIIAMEYTAKGEKKILKKCTIPMTATGEVDMIITEKAVFERENGVLVLKETYPGVTVEEIRELTEAGFTVDENLKTMSI
ncbi:MAG: Butyrate-acetoacetate CoA-transferase subunit B [Clostridiales bacterium 38_11]|nr:MAG: Butyrate-acetoacetate CoA-transferase subunit B [Clostridiales bacterium 38_11]